MAESIQKEDWERFRALGSVPPSIREVVLRSWVRSRDKGDLITRERAPSVAWAELAALRSRNGRLRSAAQGAIGSAGYMLSDTGMMVLLCDRDGVVLDASGDARVLSRGEENHLQPGGCWDEGVIGTNAIGTALQLAKPVTITGIEHFCEAIQRWSCAAAPIRDPFSGQLLGAVDLSGPSGQDFGQMGAFSVALALQIEEAIRNAGLRDQARLVEELLKKRPTTTGDEMLIIDREGRAVWASSGFERLAGPRNGLVRDLGPELIGNAPAMAERMRLTIPDADVDLLNSGEGTLGIIVTLHQPGRRRPRNGEAAIGLADIARIDEEMAGICQQAQRITESGVPLLIKGPVGSGKETLARALHAAGPQAGLPFEIVDCSLLDPDTMRRNPGHTAGFQHLAETGGVLCLDEPAETPRAAQPLLAQAVAHLLREAVAPVQVLSLSSVSLSERMARGDLRSDLHFRLAGAILRLPALAERQRHMAALVRHFADLAVRAQRVMPIRFTPAAMMRLQAHGWPGNLRELRNLVDSLSATSLSRLIDVADLPPQIASPQPHAREDTLRDRERADILDAVAETGGNMAEAARRLGISRSTLYLKLDQYGVPRRRR